MSLFDLGKNACILYMYLVKKFEESDPFITKIKNISLDTDISPSGINNILKKLKDNNYISYKSEKKKHTIIGTYKKSKKTKRKPIDIYEEKEYYLVELMIDKITKQNPNNTIINRKSDKKWLDDIKKLIKLMVNENEVEKLITWIYEKSDWKWREVIQSPSGILKHYDKLMPKFKEELDNDNKWDNFINDKK